MFEKYFVHIFILLLFFGKKKLIFTFFCAKFTINLNLNLTNGI